MSRLSHFFAEYAKWIIVLAVFAFKFLEWWNSTESLLRPARTLPVPPPPEPAKVISG
jgi:hypothetical protein